MTSERSTWWRNILPAVLFVAICQLAGLTGVLLTSTASNPWYQALAKPSFNPPPWLFGPVWTLLYTLMGIAAFRIWRLGWQNGPVLGALLLFALQLLLNAIWTPVFFGAESLIGGAVVIVSLLVVLAIVTNRFFRLDRTAGWLLVPYFAWVAFATILNLALMRLNS